MCHKLILCFAAIFILDAALARKVHYIHWNKANPMFRLDNTDHIVDVNIGNQPWEYDQVNLICPVSKPGIRTPETHVIYSVSREEFESCRITNPKPKIVAICNQPHRLMYFTITFRSFTPTPGGLEFRPGQDYYFISTSNTDDLHRRVGGGCATHNMKMVFRVADNRDPDDASQLLINGPRNHLASSANGNPTSPTTTTTTTEKSIFRFNGKVPNLRGEYIYYYHPRDLIDLETNGLSGGKKSSDDDESWQNEALRYSSSSAGHNGGAHWSSLLALILSVWMVVLGR